MQAEKRKEYKTLKGMKLLFQAMRHPQQCTAQLYKQILKEQCLGRTKTSPPRISVSLRRRASYIALFFEVGRLYQPLVRGLPVELSRDLEFFWSSTDLERGNGPPQAKVAAQRKILVFFFAFQCKIAATHTRERTTSGCKRLRG